MAWILGTGGSAAGSIGAAGGAVGAPRYLGAKSDGGWDDDDMSDPSFSGARAGGSGGFTYQGKPYDPALNDPMVVSAVTHGDFWEDDMDHTEAVSYEGIEINAGARSETNEERCKMCPPKGKVMPMVRRRGRWCCYLKPLINTLNFLMSSDRRDTSCWTFIQFPLSCADKPLMQEVGWRSL